MRITSNDMRGACGLAALATAIPVRPLAAVEPHARDHSPARSPRERVLEGELLRANPVAAVETILSDARTAIFARAQTLPSEPETEPRPALMPFAVLFYQQHSSPEALAAIRPGRYFNQFV